MDRLANGVIMSSTLSSAVVAMTGGGPSSSVTANCLGNFCLLTLVVGIVSVSVSMTTGGEGSVGRSLDDGTDKPN